MFRRRVTPARVWMTASLLLLLPRCGGGLVAAALVGERETVTYREGILWLLDQQRADGTYRAARDLERAPSVNDSRHAVLLVSWALLTSIDRFEPVVGR